MKNKVSVINYCLLAQLIGWPLLSFGQGDSTTLEPAQDIPYNTSSSSVAEAKTSNSEKWAIYGQFTNVTQFHSRFRSPYDGLNSLTANGRTEETTDATLFAGLSLWDGAEFWVNPEVDQGFGLNNSVGVAGFPSGEAYKVGKNKPYLRFPRAFIRQVINLGGTEEKISGAANQLAGTRTSDNITLTLGKLAAVDIFDTNSYAHDTRNDFLNWSVLDAGAFDYAADSWGYTYGVAAEWKKNWWTLRTGFFQLSDKPNGKITRPHFFNNSFIGEFEERHDWQGHPGKIKLLGFINHGMMASYDDAVQQALPTGGTPDVSLVRQVRSRPGLVINVEQELAPDMGVFARASINDGSKEAYEFTDIDKSLSAGLSMKGDRWGRHDDTFGIAGVINAISGSAQRYFAKGGLGILVGDGQLNYQPEKILEMYYSLHVYKATALTVDYQRIVNPGYNSDRGPVDVGSVRIHAEF